MSTTRLSPEAQLELLRRGAVEIITEEDLLAKLREGRPLRVKLGLDPTAPHLHLGFAVVLRKLRQFQDLGHEAILVIGDGTALIGDPSERKRTRPMLTREEIARNAETYRQQYGVILDPARTRVVFNSTWLLPLTLADIIGLTSKVTVARVLERDDFQARLREGVPVFLHELLYPLAQAYDSVMVQADVELGGTDQKFNNLMGRDLQREFGQPPQVVLLTPLLVGTDGVEKMSKSLGNYIGITEPPAEMYGKVMSIPDRVMPDYFTYATDLPPEEVAAILRDLAAGTLHPRDAKRRLAREIVAMWHGREAAEAAERAFDEVFVAGGLPEEIPEVRLAAPGGPDAVAHVVRRRVVPLLVEVGLARSHSEARRLVVQGGVAVDGQRVTEPEAEVAVYDGAVLRVGKRRFVRVRLVEG
ncbi:MAG: tyrosine--tRNA ligase [Armatimonadota bacterium]|nr:tyrosine--tRNA ligase [Armatimonadota bacterium]MDR7460043.1 tyrosine--tRNA ligase [Armatimonadota bacterium]MDR7480858.1 tyrosine--tRNA ligase [Armatimonadota bacterium]MDR7489291.1 tyrosine--tRNA ligase [Armatimonadota bacterium]MDR7492400.1 tyrosine--tRNA ligase [Armatimonadota bacterium]